MDAVLKVVTNQIHKKNTMIVKNLMIKLKFYPIINIIKKGFLKKKIVMVCGLNLFNMKKNITQSNVRFRI